MKNIFKKKIKKIEEENDFTSPQPMTNGNKYQVYKELETQKNLDLATLQEKSKQLKNTVEDINSLTDAIRKVADELIREKNIEPYYLLHMQADYFCNTCTFESKDTHIKRMVTNIIRGSFFMGCAGFYKNTKLNILEPIYATALDYGIDGKLKAAKILPLSTCLQKMNETKHLLSDRDFMGFRDITGDDCENLALFHWGTMGYSAWITKWPFIKLQHMMLTIIIINGFVFNKKWIYKINNFTNIAKEIELFFNPNNPFLANVGNTEDLHNRFITEEGTKTGATGDVIDYYNKLIGVYYQLIGRKINNDYKKERNISNEVEASQENYDIVQSDWLNQFQYFIEDCKKLGINIEYVDKQKEQQEQAEKEKEKEDANKGKGNNGE